MIVVKANLKKQGNISNFVNQSPVRNNMVCESISDTANQAVPFDAELMDCKTGPGACVPARSSTILSVSEKHPELMYADIGKTSKDGKLGEVDTKFKMISDSNWIPPPCYVFPQIYWEKQANYLVAIHGSDTVNLKMLFIASIEWIV